MRGALFSLALAACIGKPCQLVCTGDVDCPAGYYCLNQAACVPFDCLLCGAACADPLQNCGACGNPCAAGQVCNGSTCAPACNSGLTNCSGGCVNLASNRRHCGACGTACATDESCASGACRKIDTCQ